MKRYRDFGFSVTRPERTDTPAWRPVPLAVCDECGAAILYEELKSGYADGRVTLTGIYVQRHLEWHNKIQGRSYEEIED